MTISQLSHPSASISARDIGRKGAGTGWPARYLSYEKSGLGESTTATAVGIAVRLPLSTKEVRAPAYLSATSCASLVSTYIMPLATTGGMKVPSGIAVWPSFCPVNGDNSVALPLEATSTRKFDTSS